MPSSCSALPWPRLARHQPAAGPQHNGNQLIDYSPPTPCLVVASPPPQARRRPRARPTSAHRKCSPADPPPACRQPATTSPSPTPGLPATSPPPLARRRSTALPLLARPLFHAADTPPCRSRPAANCAPPIHRLAAARQFPLARRERPAFPPPARHHFRAADPLLCRREAAATFLPTIHCLPANSALPTPHQPTARRPLSTASPPPTNSLPATRPPPCHHLDAPCEPSARCHQPTSCHPPAHHYVACCPRAMSPSPSHPTAAKKNIYDSLSFRVYVLKAGGFWLSRDAPHKSMCDCGSWGFHSLKGRGLSAVDSTPPGAAPKYPNPGQHGNDLSGSRADRIWSGAGLFPCGFPNPPTTCLNFSLWRDLSVGHIRGGYFGRRCSSCGGVY